MPLRITAAGPIAAPVSLVWRTLADLERWPTWTPTVSQVTRLPGEAEALLGARFRVTQPGLRPAVYTVTAAAENSSLAWQQSFPGGCFAADHRLRGNEESTEVELEFLCTGWVAVLVGAVMRGRIRRLLAAELAGLKRFCEGRRSR